ncbi:hypothetical protein, partial [Lactiplantibacillus plantarum]|uniref:hypothetical protein n=1 Tax=Lactiplantibacillus plantarum TaxID=1590 RepID=UPI0021CB7518
SLTKLQRPSMGHQKSKPQKTSHATKHKTKKHNRSATIRKKLRARQEKLLRENNPRRIKIVMGKRRNLARKNLQKMGKIKRQIMSHWKMALILGTENLMDDQH